MRIFQRIADIISANLNDMIDRFEEPEAMLKQAVREMEQAVAESLDSAVRAIANEKVLGRQVGQNRTQSENWRSRAEQAVAAGDDARARRALARKLQHDQLAAALQDEHAAAADACAKLRRQIDGMRAKLAEAQRKLTGLIARNRTAEAQGRLRSAALSNGELGYATKFDRLFHRLESAEAEVEAFSELTNVEEDHVFSDETAAVERELAALKVALGTT